MSDRVTLREFSEKHGIKKPTVNARLKRLEKRFKDKTLTVRKGNKIYLTECGLNILETSFKETPVKNSNTKNRASNGPVRDETSEVIKLYQKQIEQLETALQASRKENERLLDLIDHLSGAVSVALKDSHTLVGQEQTLAMVEKQNTTVNQENRKTKKSLLSRLAIAGKVLKGDYD